ncbi:hypothetical protein [Marinicellulosiphila megalodicopiae]|uniref:hypothetical protein n=1 Tax=Marinicellulosiphila megalodicopiae TaxID=2724896 RepID=UPI003BB00E6A
MKNNHLKIQDLPKKQFNKFIKLLGKLSDEDLAGKFNLSSRHVKRLRQSKSIKIFNDTKIEFVWSPSKIKLLGTTYDTNLAAKWRTKKHVIQNKRSQLGIKPYSLPPLAKFKGSYSPHHWTEHELSLLGTMHDTELAPIIGLSGCSITAFRNSIGIEPFSERAPINWTDQMLRYLGEMPDIEFAETFGISELSTSTKRILMKIPSYGTGNLTRTPHLCDEAIQELGNDTDFNISKKYKRARYIIRLHRQLRGIPIFERTRKSKYNFTASIIKKLGKIPDSDISRSTDIPPQIIGYHRRKMGIPLPAKTG